jgi:hypothetical protein
LAFCAVALWGHGGISPAEIVVAGIFNPENIPAMWREEKYLKNLPRT